MASIRKKTITGNDYYYLEHSYKIGKAVKKKEIYLGKEIPKDIDKIKTEFLQALYIEKYLKKLDIIKKIFSLEFFKMPKIAQEKYVEQFMIKFTYNTNRIEGSSITFKETAGLLEKGISPNDKPIKDIKEAEAHKKAFYNMLNYQKELTFDIVLYWHKLLFENSEIEIAGKIRKHNVAVSGSKAEFPFPAELNLLLREFFKWYNKNKKLHPVILAALVHLKFVSIHPFTDGNGRISRLLMNFVLNKNRFPMLNITYKNRNNYYTALERSQVKRIDQIFINHIIRRYLKEYRQYLK